MKIGDLHHLTIDFFVSHIPSPAPFRGRACACLAVRLCPLCSPCLLRSSLAFFPPLGCCRRAGAPHLEPLFLMEHLVRSFSSSDLAPLPCAALAFILLLKAGSWTCKRLRQSDGKTLCAICLEKEGRICAVDIQTSLSSPLLLSWQTQPMDFPPSLPLTLA